MKEIILTKNQVALVDDGDFDYLNQWKWTASLDRTTNSFYALRRESGTGKCIQMHRFVANTPKGLICDHINHNTLDNQKHNLRNVTNSQSQMNRKVFSRNKLGEKNIHIKDGKYLVKVYKDGKTVFYRKFDNLGDAIKTRDFIVNKYHGEFSSI